MINDFFKLWKHRLTKSTDLHRCVYLHSIIKNQYKSIVNTGIYSVFFHKLATQAKISLLGTDSRAQKRDTSETLGTNLVETNISISGSHDRVYTMADGTDNKHPLLRFAVFIPLKCGGYHSFEREKQRLWQTENQSGRNLSEINRFRWQQTHQHLTHQRVVALRGQSVCLLPFCFAAVRQSTVWTLHHPINQSTHTNCHSLF